MKSFKSTLVFAIVVAVLGGVAYWEFNKSQQEEGKKTEETKALPYWDKDQVTELRIVNEQQKELHLVRKDSKWQILAPVKDDADTSSVNSMLSSMVSDKLKKLEVEGSLNPAKYGIDEAKRFIEFLGESAKKKKVILSNKKTYDGQYYLKYGDSSDVFLASSTWDQWVNRKVSEVRNKKLFTSNELVKKLTILDGKKQIIFEKVDSKWIIDGDKEFEVDDSKVSALVTSLQNFRASEVAAEEQTVNSLKTYKLKKPQLHLRLELENGKEPVELSVSQIPKDSGDVFLYTSHRPFIYKTFKSVAEKWQVAKADFKKEEKKEEEGDKKGAEVLKNFDPHKGHNH